jgi:murein DD-endopeptidase MepM/ murein hydrolase activator NlpD
MTIVRNVTANKFYSNFSRFALDFTLLGSDGNTRKMGKDELTKNYDFHISDVKKFYTHEAEVFAPADGEIIEVVNHLEDLYEIPFNLDEAIKEDKVKEIAGNYITIKHNECEYSYLFHLLKDSIIVKVGQKVTRDQPLAKIGFSGASTVYSHLHYQLMNGPDFLNDEPLPCKFSNVELLLGSITKKFDELSIDTGDFIVSK